MDRRIPTPGVRRPALVWTDVKRRRSSKRARLSSLMPDHFSRFSSRADGKGPRPTGSVAADTSSAGRSTGRGQGVRRQLCVRYNASFDIGDTQTLVVGASGRSDQRHWAGRGHGHRRCGLPLEVSLPRADRASP
jgi:hypothetical protein